MVPISRRGFLKTTVSALGIGLLASCAQPRQTVKETVIVEGTPKVVEKEVTAVPTAVPGLESQSGVLWGLQYDPHVETYERLATLFKQKTGATLKVAPQPWPLETKLIAALAGGNPPDVVCIMGKVCVSLFFQNALMECDDLYAEMGVKPTDWADDARESFTYNGKIYGVGVEVGAVGWPVNVPVEEVEKVGLTDQYPPTNGELFFDSFESMWDLAKALQIEEKGEVVRWGLSSKGWDHCSYLMIVRSLLAPEKSDWWDLGAQKFMIDTEQGIEAMRLYAETPVKMHIETQLDQNHVDACLSGKVAIGRGNGTPSLQISESLGYHFQIAGSPKLNGQAMLGLSEGGWGFAAPRLSKYPEISREFIKMMLTDEGAIEYSKIYGGSRSSKKSLWGRRDWFADQDPDSPRNRFLSMLDECQNKFYGEQCGYPSEVDKAVAAVADKVRQGEATAAEACKELQALLEAQYQQYLKDRQNATIAS